MLVMTTLYHLFLPSDKHIKGTSDGTGVPFL